MKTIYAKPADSFVPKMISFIAKYGKPMQNLQLKDFSNIDLYSLASMCPLLKNMILDHCYTNSSVIRHPPIMQHLEKLIIYCGRYLVYEEVVHLLLSPNLREIYVSTCPSFCDAALITAFEKHRFANLQRLRIEYCNEISMQVFTSCFLSENNALNLIHVFKCSSLNKSKNRAEWVSLVDSHNWDVNIIS